MKYTLKFFGASVRNAIEHAEAEVKRARGAETEVDDVVRALASAGAFDAALQSTAVDSALLDALPPRPIRLLQRLARPTVPVFSKRLVATLDVARTSALRAEAECVDVLHFVRAVLVHADHPAAITFVELGFDVDRIVNMIQPPTAQALAPIGAPRRVVETDGLSVADLWALIADELGDEFDNWFFPGATEEELTELEQAIGHSLPADLRESLRCHNGSRDCLHDSYALMPSTVIASEWRLVQSDDAAGDHEGYAAEDITNDREVEPVFWSPSWIPVLQMVGKTEYLCCDLAPAEGGNPGQLITYAMDDFDRLVMFRSFREYLVWLLHEVVNTPDDDGDEVYDLLPHAELPRR